MNPNPQRSPARQQGVVLFIALIVLVAMSLAGVAMVRSVDTSLGIAGNLAFKQSTIQGSDLGRDHARRHRPSRRHQACDPSRGTGQRSRHAGRRRLLGQQHRQRPARERHAGPR